MDQTQTIYFSLTPHSGIRQDNLLLLQEHLSLKSRAGTPDMDQPVYL